jgi:acyl phosphate:glycerol-3-phosphate acyltransferase
MSGRDVLGIALAYGLGCLCAGYYVVRWRTGTDVRRIGSSSAGARNAGRVLGPGGFVLVLTLDALKGGAAVWAARALGLGGPALGGAAVSVVVGHVLPVQLGFQGGKGIAPSIGALLVYDPWIVLASAVVFGLAYLVSGRRLVPGGLAACALAPLTGFLVHRSRVEVAVLVALALVILVAHRGNLRAVLRPVSATS